MTSRLCITDRGNLLIPLICLLHLQNGVVPSILFLALPPYRNGSNYAEKSHESKDRRCKVNGVVCLLAGRRGCICADTDGCYGSVSQSQIGEPPLQPKAADNSVGCIDRKLRYACPPDSRVGPSVGPCRCCSRQEADVHSSSQFVGQISPSALSWPGQRSASTLGSVGHSNGRALGQRILYGKSGFARRGKGGLQALLIARLERAVTVQRDDRRDFEAIL